MTEIKNDKDYLDDNCEECGCEDESVSQNLLMFGPQAKVFLVMIL